MIEQLGQIATFLLSKTSVTDLVGNRIYIGTTPNETESWPYITINSISEINPNRVERSYRFEFRIIAHDENVTFSTLQAIITEARNEIESTNLYGTFETYGYTDWTSYNWFDELKRKFLLKDYKFYFTL